jgi:predicted porin
MKMKFVAIGACACGLSGLAAAQSTVSLSGIVDGGIEYLRTSAPHGAATVTRMQSGNLQADRMTFSAVEDLGGGMKAMVRLENQFNVDDGTITGSGAFGRDSWVALSGNLGTLTLGRYRAPTFWVYVQSDASTYKLDAYTAPNIHQQSVLAQIFGAQKTSTALGGAVTGLGGFTNNTINYRTPTFLDGLSSDITYSSGANAVENNSRDGEIMGANLLYAKGRVQAGYAYNQSRYFIDGNAQGLRTQILGLLYKFDAASVGMDYIYARDTLGRFASSWSLTGVMPVGPGQINAGVGRIISTQSGGTGSAAMFDLGYVYFLSKRTQLYTMAQKIFNGSNSTIGLAVLNSPPQGMPALSKVLPGFDPWAVTVGIRHSF